MHCVLNKDYYTFEITMLTNNSFCMPTRWFRKNGQMWCQAWRVCPQARGWVVEKWDELTVPESLLSACYSSLKLGVFLGPNYLPFTAVLGEHFYCL